MFDSFCSIPGCKYAQQLSVCGIVAQLPEHHTAQKMPPDVIHLCLHGFRTVITPEPALMPECAGARLLIIMAVRRSRQGLQASVAERICRAARGLVKAMIYVLHSVPSFAVKRNTKHNFLSRHTSGKKTAHRVVAIAFVGGRLRRIGGIMKERAVQIRKWLSAPVLIVSHNGEVIEIATDRP